MTIIGEKPDMARKAREIVGTDGIKASDFWNALKDYFPEIADASFDRAAFLDKVGICDEPPRGMPLREGVWFYYNPGKDCFED